MIELTTMVQPAQELVSSADLQNDIINITEDEAGRIMTLFIEKLFRNTLTNEKPNTKYEYPVDMRASLLDVKRILDDRLDDYFNGNYFGTPITVIENEGSIELLTPNTNKFISLLDERLEKELHYFLLRSRDDLKKGNTTVFTYLDEIRHGLPGYISTRKDFLKKELKKLGYQVDVDSTGSNKLMIHVK